MQSQPGATIESHREGPITQGEVGKGMQRLDPKQDKKPRKEASIPGPGLSLEDLPAPAICPRAVVPKKSLVDSRELPKHDCEPQVPGLGTFMPWDQAGSIRLHGSLLPFSPRTLQTDSQVTLGKPWATGVR